MLELIFNIMKNIFVTLNEHLGNSYILESGHEDSFMNLHDLILLYLQPDQ